METSLNDADLAKLRNAGLLMENEIALRSGDIVVAENVITKERRVLDLKDLLLETNKRVLRG
tara:strand:+ start:194 stop:379 length:186 start_codon:yes stop_codon:yes gene_type:complete